MEMCSVWIGTIEIIQIAAIAIPNLLLIFYLQPCRSLLYNPISIPLELFLTADYVQHTSKGRKCNNGISHI